jgi:hypothetical protein
MKHSQCLLYPLNICKSILHDRTQFFGCLSWVQAADLYFLPPIHMFYFSFSSSYSFKPVSNVKEKFICIFKTQ